MANSLNIPKAIYIYNENVKAVDFSAKGGSAINSLKSILGGKGLENFVKKNFGKIPVKILKLKERVVATKGILLDISKTRVAFDKISAKDEKSCHIILTDRLIATFDESKRLHVRASIYSFPSIISIPGIVEGPAKPREYYLYKDRFLKLGVWEIEEPNVKKRFRNRFIDYGDSRIKEVLKGYISQAIFFYITGEPFCAKRACRLFNSHWQEDLIYSQVKIGRFCPAHQRFLFDLRK